MLCSINQMPLATERPPTYCGVPCRRMAEFAIRRLQRRLEEIEDRASDARIDAALIVRGERKRLAALEAEAGRLEQRLRDLISDGEA